MMKDINDQLAALSKMEAEAKLAKDTLASSERVAIEKLKSDIRGKMLDLEGTELTARGQLDQAKLALEGKAVEDEKAAMLAKLPGQITPAITAKAEKFASTLAVTGVDPASGMPVRNLNIDELKASELAAEMQGMGKGERSAFIDAVSAKSGLRPGDLMASINGLAATGDPNARAIVRGYREDVALVHTALQEYSVAADQRTKDVMEISNRHGVGLDNKRIAEIVAMEGGDDGAKIAQGMSKSGPGEGEEGEGEEEPDQFDKDRDRLNKQLDRLENESNEPEIIAKRRAVMESPKFQAWMQERGLTDPNVAFNMLMKEARPAVKQEKNANKAIARGVRESAGEGQAASPFQAKAPREMSTFMPTEIKDTLTGEDQRQAAQASASRSLESAEEKRRRLEREQIQSELAQTPV
jgi:hypothetical protein